jgi:hypothetical protein
MLSLCDREMDKRISVLFCFPEPVFYYISFKYYDKFSTGRMLQNFCLWDMVLFLISIIE